MYILDTDHIGILQRRRGNEYELLSRRMAGHSQTEFHTATCFAMPVLRCIGASRHAAT